MTSKINEDNLYHKIGCMVMHECVLYKEVQLS